MYCQQGCRKDNKNIAFLIYILIWFFMFILQEKEKTTDLKMTNILLSEDEVISVITLPSCGGEDVLQLRITFEIKQTGGMMVP